MKRVVVAILGSIGLAAGVLSAAEKTWTGSAGDGKFSSANNWSPASALASGDSLRFANSSAVSAVNDLVGYSFAGITAAGSATVALANTGNGFTLTGDIVVTGSKDLSLYVPVTLDANVTLNVSNANFYAYGAITGAGGLTVVGGKDFYAKDAVALTNGVTVNDGRLRVEKATFTAPVTLNQFYMSSARYVQFVFQASGTYCIPITLANAQGNESTLYAPAGVYVTNTAPVVMGPNTYSRWRPDGVITHAGGIVVQSPYRSDMAVIFNGNHVISTVPVAFGNNLFFDNGTLRLAVASNKYANLKCFTKTIYTDVPYALDPDKTVNFGTSYSKNGALDLNGNDQVINRPVLDTLSSLDISSYVFTSTAKPATLTCRATASTTFHGSLDGALSLAWEPLSSAYTLTVTGKVSQTSGRLLVNAGTLRLAAEASFPNLSGLVATNTGVLRVESPSVNAGATLTLADSATLSMPAGVGLSCLTASVDGNTLTAGVYSASSLVNGRAFIAGGGTLTVLAVPLSGAVRTWTGAGADNRFSTVANWDSAPTFDGSETLLFSAAGSTGVVDGVVRAGALNFNRGTPFTLLPADDTAAIRLGQGGISTQSPVFGTPVTNTLAVPLKLAYASNLQIATNHLFALPATVSGGLPTAPLIKTGEGTLWLTGTNTFESPLVLSNGLLLVNNGTALGNPTNTITFYRMTATVPTATSNRGPLYFTDTVATNDRPLIFGSALYYIGQMYPKDGTLVLNGKVTFLGGQRIDNQGTMIFRGGFECRNAMPWMQTMPGYVMRFEANPLDFGSQTIAIDNGGTFQVSATNNTWSSIGLYSATFLCGKAGVLPTNSYVTFGVSYSQRAFLNLNGFDQQVKYINFTAYGQPGATVTNMAVMSAAPATLTLQGDSAARPFVGYFSGLASLRHRNSGTLAFTSAQSASTTTGDLLVETGTVSFAQGATWTGSTNVTVTGGTLSIDGGTGATFGGSSAATNVTRLHLTSAAHVNLAAGVTDYVRAATLDGKHLSVGSYGSTSSSAQNKSALFTGTGVLYVLRSEIRGTLITVK